MSAGSILDIVKLADPISAVAIGGATGGGKGAFEAFENVTPVGLVTKGPRQGFLDSFFGKVGGALSPTPRQQRLEANAIRGDEAEAARKRRETQAAGSAARARAAGGAGSSPFVKSVGSRQPDVPTKRRNLLGG